MTAGHAHGGGVHYQRLAWALALTGTFLVAEVIAGFAFGSLALLSDVAHMFTDAAALAIALVAIRVGRRPQDDRRIFGYRRFEILAAPFNAMLLSLGPLHPRRRHQPPHLSRTCATARDAPRRRDRSCD